MECLMTNGKVVNSDAEMIYLKRRYLDKFWEQLVFGFYFSRDEHSLVMHFSYS